jgi:hypothetical protein
MQLIISTTAKKQIFDIMDEIQNVLKDKKLIVRYL